MTAVRRLGPTWGPAVGIVVLQLVVFPVPSGVFVRGVIVGLLSALLALGMALVYRSNRIINFAQADLGTAPAVLVVMLLTAWGWNYFVAAGAGLVAAAVVGAVVELAVIRRFFHAPRLVLTVATLGLSQLLVAGGLWIPRLWDEDLSAPRIEAPFDFSFTIDPIRFGTNDLLALVMAPIAIVALAWFLLRTDAGIAVRAAAERADRAALLGVPVKRLQTLVWSGAAILAFVATFLRAGVLGLPFGSALSFAVLLRALAALMLGRLTNLVGVAASAVALGILEVGVGWNAESPLLIDPILAAVIAVALVLRRRDVSRLATDQTSTWQAATEVRPLTAGALRNAGVRAVRWGSMAAISLGLLVLPHALTVDRSLKASAVLIYGILALSLVVLTGWAGQMSLGQVAFFAIGAVVAAVATIERNADITVSLLLAAVAGGTVATLVGLPALRLRGVYLAVITFAFALATTSYLLNRRFFEWVPSERVERLPVFGRIEIASATRYYYVCLAGLAITMIALRGIRRSRTGRVLIALRDNETAAQAYGVAALRARLAAFAISGAMAAFAGALFVHHQQAFGQGPYQPGENLVVFAMAVIGGIASVPGALLGALYVRGSQWFLPGTWQLVASGGGLLFVLTVLPRGLGGLLFEVRDGIVRRFVGPEDDS